jgi:DNA-directed RNA polymerase subunit K/omega
MDLRKTSVSPSCITRDLNKLDKKTGNIYETVRIISKRANQISVDMKQELSTKLEEFQSYSDNLEEVFENREQIEMSKHYERLPKAMLIATQEFVDNQVFWKYPPTEGKNAE